VQTVVAENPLNTIHLADGLRRTIEAYDAMAEAYAIRFDGAELVDERARFVRSVATPVVLDAGCGAGRDCRLFEQDDLSVTGVDLSAGMLHAARARTNAPLLKADIRETPFRSEVFGGIWSCAVLLHLDPANFHRALREFWRVLVADGALFISVREGAGEQIRSEGYGIDRWHRFYRKEEVGDLLRGAGFAVGHLEVAPGVVAGTWVNVHATKSSC
jgi:SAM-dependent methyltransferase